MLYLAYAAHQPLISLEDMPLGFFTDVERMIREAGGNTGKWSTMFGRAVEVFGRQVIEENTSHDVRKLIDDDWLALDFVFHRIKKETATDGSLTDMAKDIQISVVNKLDQIDQTLQRGLAKEQPIGVIYPIVVIGAPFPANATTLNLIDRMAERLDLKVVGVDGRCRQPMVLDLEEFWMLLELSKHEKVFPTKLLQEWIDSPKRVSGFRNWAITSGHKLPNPSRRGYATYAMQQLFGRVI
jgi:hypothetical protein